MSDSQVDKYTSDTESIEDEIEPKLKYVRLSSDLQKTLNNSSISCIAVHSKIICLGSRQGVIHVLDHQGNNIKINDLRSHSVCVNQINIDQSGEFIGTCSDNGKVFVHSLFSKESNLHLNVGRLVKTISLDPNYAKNGIFRRFITGDDKLTLYERTFLGNLRPTILSESEGLVRNLAWRGNFIAWSSSIGVRVYDINAKCSLGLIKWEQNTGQSIDKYRCNLRWTDVRTLLIGWVDTVRVCIIRRRTNFEFSNKNLPEYLVDPVSTFQMEFSISGIAPLDHQLVLLGYPKDEYDNKNNKSLRPQLYIIEYGDNDYTDICTDSLSLNGYEDYNINDYHLDVLIDENRFFIVAPRDIVIGNPYDTDDRIHWFLQHKKFEDALDILSKNNIVKHYNLINVGIEYLDYLLLHKQYDNAGKLCMRIFGKNSSIWEEQIYKFATVHQLRSVTPYIPQKLDCKLNPHIYEMILYEYLNIDLKGFLNLIKSWNSGLYNINAVINAIEEHKELINDKNIFLEALAILYTFQKQYYKSLKMYLKLKHNDVFILIKNYSLYDNIMKILPDLIDIDVKQTVKLLNEQKIMSDIIVDNLKNNQQLLYKYLDEYDKNNPNGKFHKELLYLYSIFNRNKLLIFLKKSDHYPIQDALDICQKGKFYPEMVYLLGRIGDTKEALNLIIKELKDMPQALNFCQEHDDHELWNDLINYSLEKQESITFLLQNIGNYVDPTDLVVRIPKDIIIDGLQNSIVKMLYQYNLQVSIQEGCKKILMNDYFNIQKKLVKTQQKGILINDEIICGVCCGKIIQTDNLKLKNDWYIFYCKHAFHQNCLYKIQHCIVCYPMKKIQEEIC